MSDNRWQRVEDLFHRAVALPPEARAAFLDQVCEADLSLRREVESLVAHESEDGATFAPARDEVPRAIAHYRIAGKLGEGGMGAVYRATDTKLGREVAIKILPQSFAKDADRMARFTREAKVLASLNHPHIAQIYGIEEHALVMELVPGGTLKRPLPLETALHYAKQIAEALEAAHEKGIVHRDLKPANIMVTPEGAVKLLDFGLAAVALGALSAGSDPMDSPTLTGRATEAGMIMGTAAYMCPEQAAGQPVDKRADVWSFGVVLWEMLTGRRLFEGETASLTLAAVLRSPIDFDPLPRQTPVAIRGLLRRCLDRNAKNRLRDIGEARVAIESALAGETPLVEGARDRGGRRPWLSWSVAAVLGVGLAAAVFLHFDRRPSPEPKITQLTRDTGFADHPALSADGKLVAYVSDRSGRGTHEIWIQQVAGGQPVLLTKPPLTGWWPRFSPDGTTVYFNSSQEGGGIYAIPALGGDERLVHKGPVNLFLLSPDGAWIAFNPGRAIGEEMPLYLVPSRGGSPRRVETGLQTNRVAGWSPDGKFILVSEVGLYWRFDDPLPLYAVPIASGRAAPIATPDGKPVSTYNIQWVDDRFLMTVRHGRVSAIEQFRLQAGRWTLEGPPKRLVSFPGAYLAFSANPGGLVVFSAITGTADLWSLPVDAERGVVTGAARKLTNDQATERAPTLSADGSKLVYASDRSGNPDVWLRETRTGKETQITETPEKVARAGISPDGAKIAYEVEGQAHSIYARDLAGGEPKLVCRDCARPIWTPDSRRVTFYSGSPVHYYSFDFASGERTGILSSSKFGIGDLWFSNDGRWVSFRGSSAGRYRVFVAPVKDGKAAGEDEWIPITETGTTNGQWSPGGNVLYYFSRTETGVEIAAQPLDPGTKRPRGKALPVFMPTAGHDIGAVSLFVGRDQLLMSLTEWKSNLWKVEAEP